MKIRVGTLRRVIKEAIDNDVKSIELDMAFDEAMDGSMPNGTANLKKVDRMVQRMAKSHGVKAKFVREDGHPVYQITGTEDELRSFLDDYTGGDDEQIEYYLGGESEEYGGDGRHLKSIMTEPEVRAKASELGLDASVTEWLVEFFVTADADGEVASEPNENDPHGFYVGEGGRIGTGQGWHGVIEELAYEMGVDGDEFLYDESANPELQTAFDAFFQE